APGGPPQGGPALQRRIAREVREASLESDDAAEGARGVLQHVDLRKLEPAERDIALDGALVAVHERVEARVAAGEREAESVHVEAIKVEREAAAAAAQGLAEELGAFAEVEVAAAHEVVRGAVADI